MHVEVFTTPVTDTEEAAGLVREIHRRFPGHRANFDLEDRDKILRVEAAVMPDAKAVLALLSDFGIRASVLPDTITEPPHTTDKP